MRTRGASSATRIRGKFEKRPDRHLGDATRRRRAEIVSASGTPYAEMMLARLEDFTGGQSRSDAWGEDFVRSYLSCPLYLELIWSYWHEDGMLVQTMNAVTRRFQNVRGSSSQDPLANLEIVPLRPLNNLLWGYVQDEQHRLSVVRRNYEYNHQYGIRLDGTWMHVGTPDAIAEAEACYAADQG